MDDPEYIVLVALDTPSRSTGIYISGGVMAAPTVGGVLADILPYLGVEKTYAEDDPAAQILVMEDFTGLTSKEAEAILKQNGLTALMEGEEETVTAQIPAAGQTLPGGSQVILYFGDDPEISMTTVPDFTGMNRQQASDAAGNAGLFILVKGNQSLDVNVTVTAQSEYKETKVPVGTTIELEFTDTKAAD